jgi:hypothetical protein
MHFHDHTITQAKIGAKQIKETYTYTQTLLA